MPFRYSIRLAIGGWLSPTLFLRNIVKIGYSAKRLKVKGGGFYIAMLTKSRPAPLYNVADYRYERRRSTAPKAARLAGRRPCSRTKDFNPRPKPGVVVGTQFIDPGGTKGLVYLSTCE